MPAVDSLDDVALILASSLHQPALEPYPQRIIRFVEWLVAAKVVPHAPSLRDFVAWTAFMNTCTQHADLHPAAAFVHGACLVLLDALEGSTHAQTSNPRHKAIEKLLSLLSSDERHLYKETVDAPSVNPSGCWGITPFFAQCRSVASADQQFTFLAPTTAVNCFRVLRAMQLPKAILLEGSPGVGKTSLVSAIARATGNKLVRINLSEQTDVVDLFGSDLPVEGSVGSFAWRDGPLLEALVSGHWVLLDELNLASQSVLEALNACLDHRGEVFIPELNRTFVCAPTFFRLFACQNPLSQGGGRKGLPRSFLNRFTQVNVTQLVHADYCLILGSTFPAIASPIIESMVRFMGRVDMLKQTTRFARGCGDFNLRDLSRWCELMIAHQLPPAWRPGHYLQAIFGHRLRDEQDRSTLANLFEENFGTRPGADGDVELSCTPPTLQIDELRIARQQSFHNTSTASRHVVIPSLLPYFKTLALGMSRGWMVSVAGPSASGKTTLVRLLAGMCGAELKEFSMNSAVDTTELLGGFEQYDAVKEINTLANDILLLLRSTLYSVLTNPNLSVQRICEVSVSLQGAWAQYTQCHTLNGGQALLDYQRLEHVLVLLSSFQSLIDFDLKIEQAQKVWFHHVFRTVYNFNNMATVDRIQWHY